MSDNHIELDGMESRFWSAFQREIPFSIGLGNVNTSVAILSLINSIWKAQLQKLRVFSTSQI